MLQLPKVIGHRGAAAYAPENTLESFREARRRGVTWVETDIVLLVRTRDIAALRELVLNSFQNMPEVLSTQTVLIFDELRSTRQTRSPSAG